MKKFTKLFISIFALAALALPVFCTACDPKEPDDSGKGKPSIEAVDYVSTLSLDFSSNTKKQEVTVRLFVDGDTTHFDPVKSSKLTSYNAADFEDTQGYIKARYIAVNTPESTGKIEEWGKKASKFTRSKLETAQSIVVESDDNQWNIDSTGERYVLWIWYQPKGTTEYRNLNLELLQEGLAFGSSVANNRYGTLANSAMAQARSLGLYVFSKDKDPDFPYGLAIPVTLKELRCNVEDYDGQRVKVEGIVSAEFNNSVYIEDFDAEEGISFGMSVYYGFQTGKILEILSIGNRVSVVGVVSYYEGGDTYQISDVSYNEYEPTLSTNSNIVSKDHEPLFAEVEAKDIVSGSRTFQIEKETKDDTGNVTVTTEKKTLACGEALMSTTVTVKELTVKSIYTTHNGGKSDGAMSITCEASDGTEIVIRTEVLKVDGVLVTAADYPVGTKITVKGIIDKYDDAYQVKVYRADFLTIVNQD